MSEYIKMKLPSPGPLSRSWDTKSPPALPAVSEETSTGTSTPSAGSTSGSLRTLEKQDSRDATTACGGGGGSGGGFNYAPSDQQRQSSSPPAAASFSIALDLEHSPSPEVVDHLESGRFRVDTLDNAKKKLACLANEKIEKSVSPLKKDETGAVNIIKGANRPASKSDADRKFSQSLFSNEKNAPYATFHGVSNFSRVLPTTPWTSLFRWVLVS